MVDGGGMLDFLEVRFEFEYSMVDESRRAPHLLAVKKPSVKQR